MKSCGICLSKWASHPNNKREWLTCGRNFVQSLEVLVLVIAWNVVTETDGGQWNEAVVEGVQVAPFGLDAAEHGGRYQKEAHEHKREY